MSNEKGYVDVVWNERGAFIYFYDLAQRAAAAHVLTGSGMSGLVPQVEKYPDETYLEFSDQFTAETAAQILTPRGGEKVSDAKQIQFEQGIEKAMDAHAYLIDAAAALDDAGIHFDAASMPSERKIARDLVARVKDVMRHIRDCDDDGLGIDILNEEF